ncbi:unnamed protein product, partial [Iphiclides podalirius]
MGYLSDKGVIPSECKETADLLLFFDNIFDSLNGSFEKKHLHALWTGNPQIDTPKNLEKCKKDYKDNEFYKQRKN